MPKALQTTSDKWKAVRSDMMLGKHRKKSRHKMSLSKLCSCMSGEVDSDFPDSAKPYTKMKTATDQSEGSQNADNAVTQQVALVSPKGALQVTNEEPEPAQDIEIPPPMEIQDHSFKANQDTSQDESTSLKTQTDNATSSLDLATEIEKIVKQRMDPPGEAGGKFDPSLGLGASLSDDRDEEDDKSDGKDSEDDKAKYLKKRDFVVQELIDTERDYVKDLGLVIEGYMEYMKENGMPDDMEGKDKIVFGNIHQIYDWHKETFKCEIEKCKEESEKIGSLFVRYERRLYMYVKYCENKPKSEYVVAEYIDTYFEEIRQKLGHRLTLSDLLIKPVQRIMKYQLLLKDILKYTERAGLDVTDLKKAQRVMRVVPKAANDMMQVGRLQGFDGKITAQGKLLLQETLLVAEVTPAGQQKFKERHVFLFEQIIIFSEMTEKRKGDFSNANYVFKNSVKVNKMSMINSVENEPTRFMLVDRTPGSDLKFLIQAPSEENKETWVREIRSILDMQGDFLRALQSPIAYQKELTKELSAPEFGSLPRDSQLRKTQSHPQSKGGAPVPSPLASQPKAKRSQDTKVQERCKSVPNPLADPVAEQEEDEASGPNSPTDTSKDLNNVKQLKVGGQKATPPSSSTSSDGIAACSDSPKPKKTIFEGFRNTLRKSKNDGTGTKSPEVAYANTMPDLLQGNDVRILSGATSSSVSRSQTSDDSPSSTPDSAAVQPLDGSITQGRIICDYLAIKEDEISVSRGEIVQILGTNQYNMFLVHRPANNQCPAAEGWIPGQVLGPKEGDGSLKKLSWQMFKLKKPSFKGDKSPTGDGMNSLERKTKSLGREGKSKVKIVGQDLAYEMPPVIQHPLTNVTVQSGDMAILSCKICGRPRPNIAWRFQDVSPITMGPRFSLLYNEEGIATLQISQVTVSDSGEYSCFASSEMGSVVTRATLIVLDRPGEPGKPVIRNQVGTAVHLEWSPPPASQCGQIQGYTVEYREVGNSAWQLAIPYVPNTSQVIGDLEPGIMYEFRVSANNAVGISEPSATSDSVTIPTEHELSEREESSGAIWKATFENDFMDVGEIGRGRFSVVRKCIQKCSGQEMAAKCITRKLLSKQATETEFNTLQSLQHPSLIQVFDLYEAKQNLIIIMQYLPHGRLLEYICSKPHFDEIQAAEYTRQLLEVLHYLHNCRIAHLDVKPENLLVEVGPMTTCVKLIDFGDARHIYNNYYIHPMIGNPEFIAPEIVSSTPVGLLTDIWSAGIIIYVLLSGVSPFLDESQEETCSNIVRNDYCFPDEYFAGISSDAKDLIRLILVEELSKRPTAQSCLESAWIRKALVPRSSPLRPKPILTSRLVDFMERRRHQTESLKH